MREKGSDPFVQNRLSEPSQIAEFFHKTETKHICMIPINGICSHFKALNHSEAMNFKDYETVSVRLQHLRLNY